MLGPNRLGLALSQRAVSAQAQHRQDAGGADFAAHVDLRRDCGRAVSQGRHFAHCAEGEGIAEKRDALDHEAASAKQPGKAPVAAKHAAQARGAGEAPGGVAVM